MYVSREKYPVRMLWKFLNTPGTIAHKAPLSFGFSRQDYWSWLPFPSGDLPDPRIEHESSTCVPCIAGRFFTTEPPGKPWWAEVSNQSAIEVSKHLILCWELHLERQWLTHRLLADGLSGPSGWWGSPRVCSPPLLFFFLLVPTFHLWVRFKTNFILEYEISHGIFSSVSGHMFTLDLSNLTLKQYNTN